MPRGFTLRQAQIVGILDVAGNTVAFRTALLSSDRIVPRVTIVEGNSIHHTTGI